MTMTKSLPLLLLLAVLLISSVAHAKLNEPRALQNAAAPKDDTEVFVVACFSGDTTVQAPHGPLAMKDLQVGDKILTASGRYEPVYAFGHYLPGKEEEFLVLETNDKSSQLEVTHEHLLYRQGTLHPVPAGSIQVGDKLQPHGAVVSKIGTIHKTGLYAPLVASGSFLVNNGSMIKVSSYAILVQEYSTGYAHFTDGTPFFPQHTGIHMVLTPYRMVCTTFLGACGQEEGSYTEEGLPPYVTKGIDILTWADHLPLTAQVLLLVVAFVAFGALVMVEKLGLVTLLVTSGWLLVQHRRRRSSSSSNNKLKVV